MSSSHTHFKLLLREELWSIYGSRVNRRVECSEERFEGSSIL